MRGRAAELLRELGDADAEPARPAPLRQPPEFFESDAFLHPPFSPHAFIETRQGTIEIELNVVDAPVTAQTFVELARAGFFNGVRVHRLVPNFVIQAGDPRGDGEGGPGYAIRDELSPLPFVRGTVGMAIDGRDTGGSQFFITVSPQPHLDGKYTVFGRVVNGVRAARSAESQWDVIERVRIWDGVKMGCRSRTKKGGDSRPLFSFRAGRLPLLAALFLAALGCFLRHCLCPPLRAVVRWALTAPQCRCLPARRPARQRPASLRNAGAAPSGAMLPAPDIPSTKKRVPAVAAPRSIGVTRQHPRSSCLVNVPNKWAERIVLTQDVDYG